MMVRLLAFLLLLPTLAWASDEQVVLGLSQDRVAITARFDGSDILVFGAVKRESTIPETELDVVIAITGPVSTVTVRRKDRKYGIWVNAAAVKVGWVPSFYAVATSGPFDTVLLPEEDQRHNISIERSIHAIVTPGMKENVSDFTKALLRIQRDAGVYQMLEGTVNVDQQTLFRTSINLPSNLTEGDYKTRIFLAREGKVISSFETTIAVQKVGLERFLFNLAQDQATLYGLLSLALAVFAGWGASAIFQLIRQG
ncbi:MAG: TIGR02186 family protein [Thalassovita sp.]